MARILAFGLAVAAAGIACSWNLYSRNTMADHPNWRVVKATTERSVAHGVYFRDQQVSLYKNELNLGAWHGFNEILWRKPLPLRSLEIRARFAPESYLVVEFNRTKEGYSGVRISNSPLFKSIFFNATADGQFTRKTILQSISVQPGINTIQAELTDGSVRVTFNGKEVFSTSLQIQPLQQFGLRNGHESVFLESVSAYGPGNGLLAHESFHYTNDWGVIFLLFLVLVLGFDWVAAEVSQEPARSRNAALIAISINLTLCFCAGVLYGADYFYYSGRFKAPTKTFSLPAATLPNVNRGIQAVKARELESFKETSWPKSPEIRGVSLQRLRQVVPIVFVGSSQTYGEGASSVDRTWPSLTIQRLQHDFPGLKVTGLNGGQPGATAATLFQFYRNVYIPQYPALTIIDLSNNDEENHNFKFDLEPFLKLNRQLGIRTILVLEPNSIEFNDAELNENHRIMIGLARKYNVPYVDMHGYLESQERYDSGFLWWDYVHMTDYGYRLFAAHLYPYVVQELSRVR